jgi:cell division protein FtsI (penicillin-binding protein 3)
MAKPAARIVFLEVVLLVAGAAVLARSFWLQVVHRQVWVDKAENMREGDRIMPARRGRIYDRNGQPLAVSREQYRVKVSLNQVKDTAALEARLVAALNISKAMVAERFRDRFPFFYGPFRAEQVAPVRGARGVHFEVLYNREYPMQLAGPYLGRLNQQGDAGIEGMEKALDTLLQGRSGRQRVLFDSRGTSIPEPGPPIVEPVAGHDVRLTLDNNLQGIAEGALRKAVHDNDAHGGDIVVIDVHTGELLAVASLRLDSAAHEIVPTSSAIVEPNEPGSTSKLFTVAALLRTGADTTPVFGENGHWLMPVGRGPPRPINDVHALHGMVTVGDMVKYSSNIAISKFSLRLKPEQQYQAIRDFGFGTSPGLGFPGEASGKLDHPVKWVNDLLSQPSLGQGYEWEASAVQLAAGYAAIANNGVLMAPALLREVRDEHGIVTWQHHADTVRRAIPDSIARHLFEYLEMTEGDGGTGVHAQLDRFPVPGKTGTAKVLKEKGGGYRGSYAGLFPADHPQVVVYVMIDRPHGLDGKFYGGDVAAPVVRETLQQALLAPTSPLDRRWLVAAREPAVHEPVVQAQTAPEPATVRRVAFPVSRLAASGGAAVVPAVAGQSARDAVVAIQRAGFQVRLAGHARVRSTTPAAGDSLPRGAVVQINADSLR